MALIVPESTKMAHEAHLSCVYLPKRPSDYLEFHTMQIYEVQILHLGSLCMHNWYQVIMSDTNIQEYKQLPFNGINADFMQFKTMLLKTLLI